MAITSTATAKSNRDHEEKLFPAAVHSPMRYQSETNWSQCSWLGGAMPENLTHHLVHHLCFRASISQEVETSFRDKNLLNHSSRNWQGFRDCEVTKKPSFSSFLFFFFLKQTLFEITTIEAHQSAIHTYTHTELIQSSHK